MKSKLSYDEICNLNEDLDELIIKSEKMLGYTSNGINQTIKDLLNINTKESITLAKDIISIEEDISIINNYYDDIEDDPFINLYNEDEEL